MRNKPHLPAAILALTLPALADQLPTKEGISAAEKQYSPYAGRSFPTQVFWGDTHLHTAVSVDAGTMCTVEQEDAFRFARGEEITTTGSRMTVRFFGGWEFDEEDTKTRLPAAAGYDKGVPMGGDLSKAADGQSPTFLVAAMKDPMSGNLDRIQIIKGWLSSEGKTEEKVYDVVWSGDRTPGSDGKLPSVGNTVDVANATWSNSIGSPELITTWTDPDFDPAESAFYYARVIEIPTPRWTAYEAMRYGVKMDDKVPMTTTERAYTSPIWYTP